MKINVYTSCYSKMLARHKNPNDIYIQVSRSLFFPKKGVDNKSIMSMIDMNFGENLGMYEASLEEYEQRIKGEEYFVVLKELAEVFTEEFLLAGITEEELAETEKDIKALEKEKTELLKKKHEERLEEWKRLTLEEKETLSLFGFTEETLRNVADWKPCLTYNFYLLCFEDLDTTYTEKDEKKNPDCKAGTFKTCHRTVLAKVLNHRFRLDISEWQNPGINL